jgi:hypothetical protein
MGNHVIWWTAMTCMIFPWKRKQSSKLCLKAGSPSDLMMFNTVCSTGYKKNSQETTARVERFPRQKATSRMRKGKHKKNTSGQRHEGREGSQGDQKEHGAPRGGRRAQATKNKKREVRANDVDARKTKIKVREARANDLFARKIENLSTRSTGQ